jgi:hypothetical protein
VRLDAYITLFGSGDMKPFKKWEVTKILGEVDIPWKSPPEKRQEPDEKRKARNEANKKSREETLQKALALAQRDYERYA